MLHPLLESWSSYLSNALTPTPSLPVPGTTVHAHAIQPAIVVHVLCFTFPTKSAAGREGAWQAANIEAPSSRREPTYGRS